MPPRPTPTSLPARQRVQTHVWWRRSLALLWAVALAACGAGGGDGDGAGAVDPPPSPPSEEFVPSAFDGIVAEAGPSSGAARLRFQLPGAEPKPTDYDVRWSVLHLSPNPASPRFAGQAATATWSGAIASPGSEQVLLVTGLEAGQSVQLSLRARGTVAWGPFSHGVGVRVPGSPFPAPPAAATILTTAGRLDREGTTYVLAQDISVPGTAFTIAAKNIVLDLGGHTVTYGTSGDAGVSGVYAEYLYHDGLMVVRNGTLRQGGAGADSPAINVRGGHDMRFSALELDVQGANTSALQVYDEPTGSVRVDHCTVRTRTNQVVDRHFPGVAGIWLGGITKGCEIDHNLVDRSPQWGIKVQGRTTAGPFWIHHNRVLGTRSEVANAYMLGIHKPNAVVFENEFVGESRGIHLDGQDNFGHAAEVHDNRIRAQDRPNDEYPIHWAHGIRIESASNAFIHHNDVWVGADAAHAEAMALAISMGAATDVVCRHNRFAAISTHAPFLAKAYVWVGGANAAPADIDIRGNVFQASDIFIARDWGSTNGGPLAENVWVRDPARGAGERVLFERIDVSDIWPSNGHRIVDAITVEDMDAVEQWAQPALWTSERWFTLRIDVATVDGAPIDDVGIVVEDRLGSIVVADRTDAQGQLEARLRAVVATNGPAFVRHGPFRIVATHPVHGSHEATVDLARRTAIEIVLGATPSHARDETPPEAPAGVFVHALSSSRLRVRWAAPAEDEAVVGWMVEVDGSPAALVNTHEAFLGGLEAGRSYSIRVRALDAGGNAGEPSAAVALATWPEDRAP